MRFNIIPVARRTDSQPLFKAIEVEIAGLSCHIKDLAIVFESMSCKTRYYIPANGTFSKKDVSGFERVWFEYGRIDKEYEIELLVH